MVRVRLELLILIYLSAPKMSNPGTWARTALYTTTTAKTFTLDRKIKPFKNVLIHLLSAFSLRLHLISFLLFAQRI